ncbi:hypothetical protein SJI00_07090 [Pseudomonas sp. RP23018S]|uniref:hypothetical protein n=1 Tax=Pseudomonas sp. RP23018S TaxID=3096037 RepID=UPI002ACA7654|nr:hypothetical protein [Pseudomonas sp. RP23018S]MDZ5602535.1 hypothetical protein [Pseudomonas sp. RP23018S]
MRLQSLLAFAAIGALSLPFTATAGEWPAGTQDMYMTQCEQVATGQGLDAKAAQAHCKCGAQAIEKNFSTEEIKALDSKHGVDPKLAERARTAVTKACAAKG